MMQVWWPWAMRAVWASLPFTAGPAFADALDGRSGGFATAVRIGLWAIWGVTLLAALVPHTASLTLIRIVMPAALPAAIWAAAVSDFSAAVLVGLGFTAVAGILVLGAPVGAAFIDGTAYGDEHRLALRAPGALLLGPIQLSWVVCVIGSVTGPLLLAAQRWLPGVIVAASGLPVAALAARSLGSLAMRWMVFVPAGVVLHDRSALHEPVLFPREQVKRLGPVWGDSPATDLTLGSPGVPVAVQLNTKAEAALRATRGGQPESITFDAFLTMPTQPGRALVLARQRGFPVS